MGYVSCIQASICPMNGLSARLFTDLVGKPFARDARGPDAYDCLGLVIEVTRRNGFAVPEYASTSEELARQQHEGLLGPCRRVERAEPGCVVLLRSTHATGRHLGIMIDRWRMIHASEDAGQAVIETLQRSLWGRRVLGFYMPESTC